MTLRTIRLRSASCLGRIVACTAVAMAATVGVSCGSSQPSLILYNGQHPQLTTALVKAFEKQTGINVSVRTNDGIVLAEQLLQEGKSSPADVFLTENSPELLLLQQKGLLSTLPASTLAQVPAADNSPNGDWVGVAARVSALAWNPSAISVGQLPPSLLDLANPQWKGRIGVAPSDSDFVPLVSAVIATDGADAAKTWLAGLRANATIYEDDEAVVSAVNQGSIATGIINSYYWFRLQLEVGASAIHSQIYYFPQQDVGGLENISGAAVLATSKNKTAADKFVAFLVSAQGQQILAAGDDFEYPIRPEVEANSVLPPIDSVNPDVISLVSLGNDLQASDLIQQAGLL
jgi:iron(III) transport system substrate-binding protein